MKAVLLRSKAIKLSLQFEPDNFQFESEKLYEKKELIIISILTILLAFMDISGLPSALFINIEVLDITPFYWTLMFNFIIIGIVAFLTLKYLCPNWKLGLNKKELKRRLKNME